MELFAESILIGKITLFPKFVMFFKRGSEFQSDLILKHSMMHSSILQDLKFIEK